MMTTRAASTRTILFPISYALGTAVVGAVLLVLIGNMNSKPEPLTLAQIEYAEGMQKTIESNAQWLQGSIIAFDDGSYGYVRKVEPYETGEVMLRVSFPQGNALLGGGFFSFMSSRNKNVTLRIDKIISSGSEFAEARERMIPLPVIKSEHTR